MISQREIASNQANIEIRQTPAGFQFRGYAAVYYRAGDKGTEYAMGEDFIERIEQRAFDEVLSRNPDVLALFNHNPDNMLGKTSAGTATVRADNRGLYFEVPYDETDPDHQRAAAKARRGELGASFGFRNPDDSWERSEGNNIRTLRGFGDLVDVSVVSKPAYNGTTAQLAEIRDAYTRSAAIHPSDDIWAIMAEKRLKELNISLE